MPDSKTDILIIGGGFVGFALAAALKNTTCKVTIVENSTKATKDNRAIAIAFPTKNFLQTIGAWSSELEQSAQPITNIRISEQGRFGKAQLCSAEHDLAAFGYVVEAWRLQEALAESVGANCQVLQPATVKTVVPAKETADASVQVEVISEGAVAEKLNAELVIAADGVRSQWREQWQLPYTTTDYENVAVVANITTEQIHNGIACERFTRDGLMALLPMSAKQFGLVWSVPKARGRELCALSSAAFTKELHQQFGYSLGRFLAATEITSFPLTQVVVTKPWLANMLCMGSSAHHLHPVAGQGLNLSLRDVACLAELLQQQTLANKSLSDIAMLQRYEELRKSDWQQVTNGTHGLVKLFATKSLPLQVLRSLGLVAFDRAPLLQRYVITKAAGFTGILPSLCCGVAV